MTLRTRLLIGFGLVLVALATAMVVVATTQRNYALDQLDRQLDSALPFAIGPPGGVIIDRPSVPPDNSSFEARTSDFSSAPSPTAVS